MNLEQFQARMLTLGMVLLEMLVVIVISFVIYYILRYFIGLMVKAMMSHGPNVKRKTRAWFQRRVHGRDVLTPTSPMVVARRVQRAQTMGSVLRSIAALLVFTGAVFYIFSGIFEVSLTPLLASAGIVGAALGFGAQSLVKDFLSGIANLVEDQYGVGDVVDLGEAIGTVEEIGLRVTQVRSLDGTLWYVRNGEILRVGNMTQDWSRAMIDLQISAQEDPDRVKQLMLQAANRVRRSSEFAPFVLEDPMVTGVEDITAKTTMLRLLVKTAPAKQWEISRALREEIRRVMLDADVQLALAMTGGVLWASDGNDASQSERGVQNKSNGEDDSAED